MVHAPLAFKLELAREVKAPTLEPRQQPTSSDLRTATDFRQQWMIKHPELSTFHSRAEHLHAALLEGDPTVLHYVPQPFRLQVGRHWYTPDCFIASDARRRRVVELRPDGEMSERQREPLAHFFAQYGMVFEVVSNESVLAREVEAENWAEIVRILHQSRDFDTAQAEYRVLDQLAGGDSVNVGDIVDPGDRKRTYPDEIALFRLLHGGHVRAELTERPLDFDTEVSRCD